jgi:hypothetical protein
MSYSIEGPWYVAPNSFFVTDKQTWIDKDGARCGETPNFIIECPSEDIANLVSAAPRMLSALKLVAPIYEHVDSRDTTPFGVTGRAVLAAIAKAEGTQT